MDWKCAACNSENSGDVLRCACGNEFSPPPDIPKNAEAAPQAATPPKASSGFGGIISLVIVAGVIWSFFSQTSNKPPSISAAPSVSDIKQQIKGQVRIENLKWNTGASDIVMMLSATLVNQSDRDIKDLEITCEHFSNSGTKIDSNNRTVYEIIKAGKSKKIRDFNMGIIHSQVATTNCSVSDLVVQ